MPLPTPRKKETRNEFISRCMDNETMKKEFPEEKQRVAVCYSQLRKSRGKSAAKPKPKSKLEGILKGILKS